MKWIILVASLIQHLLADSIVVNTNLGKIAGITDNKVHTFKGIPYANPPIKGNRWRPPDPIKPWSGIKSALAYAPSCHQLDPMKEMDHPPFATSEDCLYINIWAPMQQNNNLMPVLVWLNAGQDLRWGHANHEAYSGYNLSYELGVIVITINFRVGPFGFLGNKFMKYRVDISESTGNYGLMDQEIALLWIKENIHYFGGDPHAITLIGVGSGAETACALALMKGSKTLFNRLILEETMCKPKTTKEESHRVSMILANKLGCPSDFENITAACLRAAIPHDIIAIAHNNKELWDWNIIADERFPDSNNNEEYLAAIKKAPLMMIYSTKNRKNDIRYYKNSMDIKEFKWSDLLEISKGIYGENSPEIIPLYGPQIYESAEDAAISLVTDYDYIKWINILNNISNVVPTYLLTFDRTSSDNKSLPTSSAIQDFFLNTGNFTKEDKDFSKLFQHKLESFIKFGTYNGHKYTAKDKFYTELKDGFVEKSGYKDELVSKYIQLFYPVQPQALFPVNPSPAEPSSNPKIQPSPQPEIRNDVSPPPAKYVPQIPTPVPLTPTTDSPQILPPLIQNLPQILPNPTATPQEQSTQPPTSSLQTWLIIGVSAAVVVILIIIFVAYKLIQKRKQFVILINDNDSPKKEVQTKHIEHLNELDDRDDDSIHEKDIENYQL